MNELGGGKNKHLNKGRVKMAEEKTILDFQEELQKKRMAAAAAMPQTFNLEAGFRKRPHAGKTEARPLKEEEPVVMSDIVSLPENYVLAKNGRLISVTKKGLAFKLEEKNILVPRKSSLKIFLNHRVELFLSGYELYLEGVVKAFSLAGDGACEVFVGFAESAPPFYRACVADLLN